MGRPSRSLRAALVAALALLAARAAVAAGFTVTTVHNRVITPNGDGRNDFLIVQFDNPSFAEVMGNVYDVRGAFVSAMTAGPDASTTLQWDGKSSGRVVPTGVYIYVVQAEGTTYKGAVLVVR